MARLIDADKIVNGIALYMTENAYLNDTPLDALKMVAKLDNRCPNRGCRGIGEVPGLQV